VEEEAELSGLHIYTWCLFKSCWSYVLL